MQHLFKWIFYIIFLLLFVRCTPKYGIEISNPQPALSDTAFVLILQEEDEFINDGIKIGTLRSGNASLKENCTYEQIAEQLKMMAKKNGANVVKITHHLKIGEAYGQGCDRIVADIYKVSDYRKFEKLITWSSNHKLSWIDFKAQVRNDGDNLNVVAKTVAAVHVQHIETLFSQVKIYVSAVFSCNQSWASVLKRDPELLAHEQLNFDFCEVYARKLRKEIAEDKSAAHYSLAHVKMFLTELEQQYEYQSKLYEMETAHGLNKEAQAKWAEKITTALGSLAEYAQ